MVRGIITKDEILQKNIDLLNVVWLLWSDKIQKSQLLFLLAKNSSLGADIEVYFPFT